MSWPTLSSLRTHRLQVASESFPVQRPHPDEEDRESIDMTVQETSWQAAESAAAVLAPEADLLASVDASGLGASTFAVMRRAAAKPGVTTAAALRYWTSIAMAGPVAMARWMGADAPPPVPVPDGDKRFADRTWH